MFPHVGELDGRISSPRVSVSLREPCPKPVVHVEPTEQVAVTGTGGNPLMIVRDGERECRIAVAAEGALDGHEPVSDD